MMYAFFRSLHRGEDTQQAALRLAECSAPDSCLVLRVLAELILVRTRESVVVAPRAVDESGLVPFVLCLSCGRVASRSIGPATRCPALGSVGSVQAAVDVDTMTVWCRNGPSPKSPVHITKASRPPYRPTLTGAVLVTGRRGGHDVCARSAGGDRAGRIRRVFQ